MRVLTRAMLRRGAGASLLLAAAACSEPDLRPVAGSILTVDAAVLGARGPVDVQALAAAAGHQLRPIDGETGRPVRCLEVLDVDVLRVMSDRGEEVVRVFGLGGQDPRWPAELNDYLQDVARPAAMAWLTAPGTQLVEVSVPLFAERGAAGGPSHRDAEGRRLITLQRRDASGTWDYQTNALGWGWAYEENPYDDILAIDPRLALHVEGQEQGLFGLDCVRRLREEFETEGREFQAMDEDALQALGEEVLADVAAFLEWEPAAALRYHRVTAEQAEEPVRAALQQQRQDLDDWLDRKVERIRAEAAARGQEIEVQTEQEFRDLDEEVAEVIEQVNGYSPRGPDVWLIQKGNESRELLRQVLVHEIMHQYQEEVVAVDGVFPMIGLPLEMGEAQAEWLSMRYRDDRWPLTRANGPLAYPDSVALFDSVLEDTGLTHVELLHHYLHELWDPDRWNQLRNGTLSLQEWRFLELDAVTWDGLTFEPVTSDEGWIRVRIRDDAGQPFRGQFHGVWIWKIEDQDGPSGSTGTVTMAPFNLTLAAGAEVVLQLGDGTDWLDYPPVSVIGLFSRSTPSAGE